MNNNLKINIILFVVSVAGFLFVFWKTGQEIYSAKESLFWPSTQGNVIKSEYILVQNTEAGDRAPVFNYSYNVAGINYKSKSIRHFNGGAREHFVARYQPGDHIQVFFDPKHNDISVIENGLYWGDYSSKFILITLLLFALLFWAKWICFEDKSPTGKMSGLI